jgi:hypothetical protein
MENNKLTNGQKELLKLINPVDARCVSCALRRIFNMALFSAGDLRDHQKDDLYILNRIIEISDEIENGS